MPIKEARVATVATMSDRSALGASILSMRKWPRTRGFNRFSVDFWLPDLGPSLFLLEEYRKGDVDWTTFAERYKAEQRAATSCRVVALHQWRQSTPYGRGDTEEPIECAARDRRGAWTGNGSVLGGH